MALRLPRFPYTLRKVSTGAVVLHFAHDNTVTNATIAATLTLPHLARCSLDFRALTLRTDHGTEFDGQALRKADRGFVFTIEQVSGAHHRSIPPRSPNPEVQSFHATVEPEFFDCHNFDCLTDILEKTFLS